MAYATYVEVLDFVDKFGLTIGDVGGEDFTTTVVAGHIATFDAQVNGILTAQGYGTIPATGTNDVAMLQRLVAQRTAALLYMDKMNSGNEFPAIIKLWLQEWDDTLKRLKNGEQSLVDQEPTRADYSPFGVTPPKVYGA